jgi:hypothetical protein
LDNAGDLGEQGIVFSDTDIQPGLELRAALANEDRASGDQLACEPLYSEPLRVAVAAIA